MNHTFASRRVNGTRNSLAIVAAMTMIFALFGFVSTPASAVGTATITGQLTAPGGTPIAGVQIDAYDAPSPQLSSGTSITDANGNFSIGSLPAGTYALHVHDDFSAHQWAGGETTFESAEKFTVVDGQTLVVAIEGWKLGSQVTLNVTPGVNSATLTITLAESGIVNPTGKVKLSYKKGKSNKIKSVTVTNGSATVNLTNLKSGKQKFSADFVGAKYFRSSRASTTVTIN